MAQSNDLFSKEGYWQEFINYLTSGSNGEKVKQNGLNLPKPNDLNWYPIRFGNSHVNIEHSFNSKNRTIRASLIIKNDPDLFNKIEADKASVEAQLTCHGGTVQWDGVSKAMHINVLLDNQDVSNPQMHSSQFAWFAALTFELKSVADMFDSQTSAAPQPKPAVQPKKAVPPVQKAPAPVKPKAETSAPVTQPAAPKTAVIDPNRTQKIIELLADFLGLSAEASRYEKGSEEMSAKYNEQKSIIAELEKIISDPQCATGITDAKLNIDRSDPKWRLADLLNLFTFNNPIYNLYFLDFGLKDTFELLLLLNQCGGKRAAYYIARCYGSGLIGKDEDGEPFVLKPDTALALKYYSEALSGGFYRAALEVGCLAMALHDNKTALSSFKFAKEHNIPEAEVYLNYMANYPDREDVYSHYHVRQRVHKTDYNHSRCGCNCIEYKGYLYFIELGDNWQDDNMLYRINCSNGQKQQLLKFKKNSEMHRGGYPLEATQIFSIANDQIFLPVGDPNAIIKMGLDGSNPCYLKNLKGKNREVITRPFAFSSFLIYQKGSTLYRYDYRTGDSTKLIQFTGEITGVSEKEIIFDNRQVLSLSTLEKVSIQKVYPALKGKSAEDIVLIDCTRELAYYRDKAQEKVFGTDKNGRIVDIWNMPRLHWSDLERWHYDTHCFNGTRWTCKYEYASVTEDATLNYLSDTSPISLPQIIASFDRSGNIIIIHEDPVSSMNNYTNDFGLFHAMTPHFDLVLRNNANGNPESFIPLCRFPMPEYWNMAFNMYSKK